MIQANHLRIGNYLYRNLADFLGNHYYQLIGWDIWQASKFPDELNIEFSPIPLTPEILEKAGFTLSQSLFEETWLVLQKGEIEIKYYDGAIILGTGDSYHDVELTNIKHLHELQNLIFALTGTELEINL